MKGDRDDYELIERMDLGIYVLRNPRGDSQVWSLRMLRKPRKCDATKKMIPAWERAYTPVTNGYNRMVRLSADFVHGLGKRSEK